MQPGFVGDPTDKQQVFDFVVRFISQQGVASANESAQCRYRGPNGTCCAAGCLVPGEEYQPSWEGYGLAPGREISNYFVSQGFDLNFLYCLQRAHDECSGASAATFVSCFQQRAARVAEDFGLSMPTDHDQVQSANP